MHVCEVLRQQQQNECWRMNEAGNTAIYKEAIVS